MAGISIMLAIVFWLLITIRSQDFQIDLSFPVSMINVPTGIVMTQAPPSRIRIMAEGPGSRILREWLKFRDDTLFIDFKKLQNRGSFSLLSNPAINLGLQKRGMRIVEFFPDSVFLKFDYRSTKKVEVVPVLDFSRSGKFRIPGKPNIFPDSVILEGPPELLARIGSVKTKVAQIRPSDSEIRFLVELDSIPGIQASPAKVEVVATPEPYTSKLIKIPVFATNLPANTSIRLDPPFIDITVLVPQKEYEAVSASDISAEVNCSLLRPSTRFLVPEIKFSRPSLELENFSPEKITFMLVRE